MDNVSYLAGIIDGEGTVNITYLESRNEYRLRLYVVSTDVCLIDWLVDNFGGLKRKRARTKSTKEHWKDRYEWYLFPKRESLPLIDKLSDILVIKGENMRIAARFIRTLSRPGIRIDEKARLTRKECHERLRVLNSRGVATTERVDGGNPEATV